MSTKAAINCLTLVCAIFGEQCVQSGKVGAIFEVLEACARGIHGSRGLLRGTDFNRSPRNELRGMEPVQPR